MNQKRRVLTVLCLAGVCLVLIALAGCAKSRVIEGPDMRPPNPPITLKKDYGRQLPPGAHALRRITDPSRMPDFAHAFMQRRGPLITSLEHSIRYFSYPSSRKFYPMQGITHARAAQSLIAFRELLNSARSPSEFERRILTTFDVYESVGCDDEGTVLFTAYYTPIFPASLKKTAEYRWPLHKLPADLVKDRSGRCLGRRRSDGAIVPYYTRKEIVAGALKGQELAWLKTRFEAYICSIQGSAKLRLPNGKIMNVGYHGNNGKEYTSVGRRLVSDGRLKAEELSLSSMIKFFETYPHQGDAYLSLNERYVFFQKTSDEPTGSIGVPVTAYCSVATDKRIFPRGCLAYVATRLPKVAHDGATAQAPFKAFVLDQDTGGAIRAPGRADIYVGVGDRAGRIAGATLAEGGLYYLFLREEK